MYTTLCWDNTTCKYVNMQWVTVWIPLDFGAGVSQPNWADNHKIWGKFSQKLMVS